LRRPAATNLFGREGALLCVACYPKTPATKFRAGTRGRVRSPDRPLVPKEYVGTVSSAALLRFALFRDRLFDFLLTDGLQLLILFRAKNLLQLRCGFVVDGPQLPYLLQSGE